MIDLGNNMWAVTIGGGVIASVAAGYVLNSVSQKKEERQREAHLRSRLKYAYELRESSSPTEALGVCEDLLTEVSEVKHPVLYGEVKTLAGELRRQIRSRVQAQPQPQLLAQDPSPANPAPVLSTDPQPVSQSANPPGSVPLIRQFGSEVRESLQDLGQEVRSSLRSRRGKKSKRHSRKKFLASASIFIWLALSAIAGNLPGNDFTEPLLFFSWLIGWLYIRYRFDEEEEAPAALENLKAPVQALPQENHPLFSPLQEILFSLDLELKQVPADLTGPLQGIQNDLRALREKAEKLNTVWRSVKKLLSQTVPLPEGAIPSTVQEQEAKTRKNLENLKAHLDAEMAETVAMLRALLAQVMQLKAAPRLTAPDSYAQIRENLKQRLLQLETVEESFHPFDSWKEKA